MVVVGVLHNNNDDADVTPQGCPDFVALCLKIIYEHSLLNILASKIRFLFLLLGSQLTTKNVTPSDNGVVG